MGIKLYLQFYLQTHTVTHTQYPIHTRCNEEVEFYWKIIGTTNTFSKMKWAMGNGQWAMVYNVIIHTHTHKDTPRLTLLIYLLSIIG